MCTLSEASILYIGDPNKKRLVEATSGATHLTTHWGLTEIHKRLQSPRHLGSPQRGTWAPPTPLESLERASTVASDQLASLSTGLKRSR